MAERTFRPLWRKPTQKIPLPIYFCPHGENSKYWANRVPKEWVGGLWPWWQRAVFPCCSHSFIHHTLWRKELGGCCRQSRDNDLILPTMVHCVGRAEVAFQMHSKRQESIVPGSHDYRTCWTLSRPYQTTHLPTLHRAQLMPWDPFFQGQIHHSGIAVPLTVKGTARLAKVPPFVVFNTKIVQIFLKLQVPMCL